MIDKTFLNKLNILRLNPNISINRGYSGSRKSKAKGSSSEFSDFREYIHGDDFRKIDWNAYGRLERLYIKEFMEEREIFVNIFMDTSRSMDFGQPKKSLLLKNIALAFSYISLNNLDRINLYYNEGIDIKESGYLNGKNSIYKAGDLLEKLKFQNEIDFFSLIDKRPYKSGVSIIISDLFTDELENIIKYLSYMNQKIIVLHLLDKNELKPCFSGDLRLIDSESLDIEDVSFNVAILKSYEKTLKTFIQNNKEICKKYGCIYSLISNEASIDEIIFDKLVRAGILR